MNIEDIRQARAAAVLTAATLLKSIGMVAMNLITEGVADPDDYLDINMVMDELLLESQHGIHQAREAELHRLD